MGNKSSHLKTPASAFVSDRPVVEQLADELPAGGLCQKDAWAIALAWRDQLKGCVRLEPDAERRGLFLIESFEWVTFVFNNSLQGGFKDVEDTEDAAAAARAATIAWYALSCCNGYSTEENPRFWRRVFTELYYPDYPKPGIVWLKPQPERPQHPITEATAFFPRKDKPFPRIRIIPKTDQEEICVRTLLTVPAANAHSIQLEQIIAGLQPFLRSSRWCRRPVSIPVAIEEVSATDLSTILQGDWLPRDPLMDGSIIDSVLPRLRLTTVFLAAVDLEFFPTQIHEILDRTNANVVMPTPLVRAWDWLFVDRETRLGRIRLSTLDADRVPGDRDRRYAPVLSALPHSQSATLVRFDLQPRSAGTVRAFASDWAWLGYAVFHPEAARVSSFTDLELDLLGVPLDHVDVFLSMAVGNNLPNESGIRASPPNRTYELASVRTVTTAHTEPSDGSQVLWAFPSDTMLTLCSVAPGRPMLDEWVCAVIPGAGLGWIRSHSIVEVTSHAAGACCLRRLRLKIHSSPARIESMLHLLMVVGDALEHLEIETTRLMDAVQVRSVLRLCPSLMSLRISHDGSCWRDLTPGIGTPWEPRLQQLELVLRAEGSNGKLELQPLKSPLLDELKRLRVVTNPQEHFISNRAAFLSTLARYPCLQYAHHTNGNDPTPSWVFKSYEERHSEMRVLLGKVQKGVHDVAQGPMRLDCSLAFLSVIHRLGTSETSPRSSSVLQRFGPDLVRNILCFSTSPMLRDLYIDEYRAEHSYYY